MDELDPRLRDLSSQVPAQRQKPSSTPTPVAPSISPFPQNQQKQQQYTPIQGASPHQSIYPQTPQSVQSVGSANHHDAASETNDGGPNDGGPNDGGPNDPKRPRACEACRGLKVRCEPDPNNPDGPCKRCAKANRNCLVTVPSRKRQKKTDSRVAELEKKIDALTATLHATKSGSGSIAHGSENGIDESMSTVPARPNPYQQVTNGGFGPFSASPTARMPNEWTGYPKPSEYDMRKLAAPPMVVAGQKRKHQESREYSADSTSPSIGGLGQKTVGSTSGSLPYVPYALSESATGSQRPSAIHEYADVVDRNIITADMAAKMFNCYVERMAPHMPAVVFPPGTTAADIRKSKPTLFLAILSASSGMNYPDLQKMLTKEVMTIYADRIICNGEKTLEIIQALHVSTLWYWPPEHFEELKFYQLIHIAAVMAIDIGMGKKSKCSKTKHAGLWRDHPWRRTPYPDPESIESRRAWLSCYFLCCNASMGLRRPNLIRWTPYMADCVDVLEHSLDAAPSDKVLTQWVRSQHIAEEVGTQFSMDDPVANVSISDSKVQHALKGFERDLEKWSSKIPPAVQSPTLTMTGHVVNLYMHEVAMHVDHNVDEFKPPFTEESLRNNSESPDLLTSAHINALSVCLKSIDGIFETFLKFDAETVRCLPVAHFVRVAYAVVVLIKMYFAAATPNSELGKVIDKDNMKVELYLDGLVDIFRASAAEEKSRPSAKFLMVLIMLKTWFHRQREGGKVPAQAESSPAFTGPATRSDADTPAENSSDSNQMGQRQTPQHCPGQKSGYSPANTPLQLLSEVATGNTGGQTRSGSISNFQSSSNDWQQTPQQPSFLNYDATMNQMQSQGYGVSMVDPSLGVAGMDLGYTMGDGFEQAMGMTLGVGDFGNYFSDDTFFGSLMDSVGAGGPSSEV